MKVGCFSDRGSRQCADLCCPATTGLDKFFRGDLFLSADRRKDLLQIETCLFECGQLQARDTLKMCPVPCQQHRVS